MEAFRECGATAYLALLLGVLAFGAGVVAVALALTKGRAGALAAGLALALACATFGAGLLGTVLGRRVVDEAVAHVDPAQRLLLLDAGYAEASQCSKIGGGLAALPFLAGVVALGLGLAARRPGTPRPSS